MKLHLFPAGRAVSVLSLKNYLGIDKILPTKWLMCRYAPKLSFSEYGVFGKTSDVQDIETGAQLSCGFGKLPAIRSAGQTDIRNQEIDLHTCFNDFECCCGIDRLKKAPPIS
jgi:hypothetical protein